MQTLSIFNFVRKLYKRQLIRCSLSSKTMTLMKSSTIIEIVLRKASLPKNVRSESTLDVFIIVNYIVIVSCQTVFLTNSVSMP